jgi:hypothetical protein
MQVNYLQDVDQAKKRAKVAQNLISAHLSSTLVGHTEWFSLLAGAACIMEKMGWYCSL